MTKRKPIRWHGYIAERQVNPALKNYYQIETYKGLSDSNFYLLCVDTRTLELLNSIKEPKYYSRWQQADGSRIESEDDEAFVDKLWENLQSQLADTVMMQHLVRAQLMLYSGVTGEEVNFNLLDPDNPLNSTAKFTSSTPFYVPKLFAPDMSLTNAIYRMGQTERGTLYNAEYPNALYGTSLADLLKLWKDSQTSPTTINGTATTTDNQELIRLMVELLQKQEETASDSLKYQNSIALQLKLMATSLGQIVGAAKSIAQNITGIKLEMPSINLASIAAPLNKISLAIGEPNVTSIWDWFTGAAQPKNILDTIQCMLKAQHQIAESQGAEPPDEGCA